VFALLSNFKNSVASSVVRPVVAGLFLSGWYIRDSCRFFSLTSISDAPNPKSRMRNDGSLSHRFELYVYLVGWEGGGGGG